MRTAVTLFIIIFVPAIALSATIIVPDDYSTIQQAIDNSMGGDTILVKPDIYVENIDLKGFAITVKSEKGPLLTIIDGNQLGSVVTCINGESPDTVLDGFTITNGLSTSDGGGMYNDSSHPTVINCIFDKNSANIRGGGMFNNYCAPTVINCAFIENTANSGGGMENWACDTTVINSTFTQNDSGSGGGMENIEGGPTIINCNFIGNTATNGGGLYSMVYNPTITNCIFWNNSPDQLDGFAYPLEVMYSCIQDGWFGIGNIDADPLFVDPANGDYHLTFQSPCRGSGDNSAVSELYDYEGDPRIAYGTVDMGADEFHTHLYYSGNAVTGGSVELMFIGLPGTFPVYFWIGFNVSSTPVPGKYGDWWLLSPVVGPFSLDSIPSNGVYVLSGTIPVSPPGPYPLYLQAIIGPPFLLTNLCTINVE